MKLRRLFASLTSACVAISAMTVVSSAVDTTDYMREGDANGTVFILADKEADPNWSVDTGIATTDVYGVTYHVEFGTEEWIGGGIGANSQSTGWKSIEWGTNSKDITADVENGTITWLSDSPVFAETDTYCQFWLQTWSGTCTIKSADILGAEGVVISATADEAAATSFAGTKYLVNNEAGKGTLFITAEEGSREPNLSADAGVDQTAIYGVTFFVDFDENEIADEAAWIGGGIGANSNSTGWLQKEWGRADKEFTADLENGTITMLSDAPIFAADDTYCQLWLQTWGGTVTVNDVALLDAEGNAISVTLPEVEEAPVEEETEEEAPAEEETEEEAPAEEETEEEAPVEEETEEEAPVEEETEEEAPAAGDVAGETDSSKGSPDTGVEDVAVVAGLAIVAAGAVLVSKKRK